VYRLGYGLDGLGSIPGGGNDGISLRRRVQTGSRVYTIPYPVSTGDSFPGGKVAEA